MIKYSGFEKLIETIYAKNQSHVFEFWNELSEAEKKELLEELSMVDFELLNKLYESSKVETHAETDFSPAKYIKVPETEEEKAASIKAKEIGERFIKEQKMAAFVVAGGQGSRLGFDGPKGAYLSTPCKNKSLFQVFCEKIKKCSNKYNATIPFFIMTSQLNHDATQKFFKDNNFFGLNEKDVYFFAQNMIPSLNKEGKLILADKNKIFTNPDGHGGSLTALHTYGILDVMREKGIEIISYFQVDNPLINIIDPVFIGHHIMNKAQVSSKTILKRDAEEKVGVFVENKNGKSFVIEYSDMPEEKIHLKDENNQLVYSTGSIAIHLFDRIFIEEITSSKNNMLPYHIACKKIKSYTKNGLNEIDGYKFEKFVFDSLLFAEKSIILETIREEEFGPIKNKSGVDSIQTSQELMNNLYRKWLNKKGIKIPGNVKKIEISPLYADSIDDIDNSLEIPDQEDVYIE